MKKHIFVIFAAVAASLSQVQAWSSKGHDVICQIAENHLSRKAKSQVDKLLDGKSMVYWANWMDSASNNKEYAYSKTWHYINIDKGETLESMKREKKGDILSAVELLEKQLQDDKLSKEEKSVALKMYIHVMGDLHQPMHVGRRSDRGGNTVPVTYFIESTNLHSLWDYHVVEGAHSWSYSEWADQIDRLSSEEAKQMVEGSPADWVKQTHEKAKDIYRQTPAEKRLSYYYRDYSRPIIEEQLLRGGRRLAHRLNILLD